MKTTVWIAVLVAGALFSGCPSTSGNGGGGAGVPDASAPQREIVVHEGPIGDDPGELPVSVVKDFTCDPEGAGSRMVVAKTAGAPGEDVVIEPTDAACHYDLIYRSGSERSALSSAPGGYLLVAARRMPDGVRGVCASDIVHDAGAGGAQTIHQVVIRCWASATTSFTASTVAITPDGEWAAWVRDVVPVQGRAGVFLVEWTRDFSFQFLNLSDEGRPQTDGVFRTELSFDGSSLTVGATTKVSSRTNPFAGVSAQPWIPTPEERDKLQDLIDFSDVNQP